MATSPRPKVKVNNKTNGEIVDLMDFYTALRGVADGKKMCRQEWNDPNVCVSMVGEYLTINIDSDKKIDGQAHPLSVRLPDMIAKDWFYV